MARATQPLSSADAPPFRPFVAEALAVHATALAAGPRVPPRHGPRPCGSDARDARLLAGERITTHRDVERRLAALDAASDRVHVETYGASVEGRALWLVFVRVPRTTRCRPRTDGSRGTPEDSCDASRRDPAFTWIACSVHGDRSPDRRRCGSRGISRPRAVMLSTGSSGDDRRARSVRIRMAANASCSRRIRRAVAIDAEPAAAERDQPWPAGRFNHALFDMNRDWSR